MALPSISVAPHRGMNWGTSKFRGRGGGDRIKHEGAERAEQSCGGVRVREGLVG